MNRADAYALMTEYTQSESLRKHMLSGGGVRWIM
jgi:predicted hydrolase (HD superfamily)